MHRARYRDAAASDDHFTLEGDFSAPLVAYMQGCAHTDAVFMAKGDD